MALQNVLFNDMLDAAGTAAVSASLHTADPGATGANEVTGGSYIRQAVSWDPASGGAVAASADITWSVPGGNTVSYVGLWDSGGVWLGGAALSVAEPFNADGTYTLTLLQITAANAA